MKVSAARIGRSLLIFCLIFVGAFFILSNSRASLLMLFSAAETGGVITKEADPGNHNYLTYEYTVNGKKFSGVGYAAGHVDLPRGELAQVFYFPPVPSESVLQSKDEQFVSAISGIFFAALMAVVSCCFDYWNRTTKVKRA